MRVALTGDNRRTYFRDVEGQDVLLFIDNIFRFANFGFQRFWVGCCLQPTPTNPLATEMGQLQSVSHQPEGICNTLSYHVPADDYTDPAPATAFLSLGFNNKLRRKLVQLGIYLPAVDPLASSSRCNLLVRRHYAVAAEVQT